MPHTAAATRNSTDDGAFPDPRTHDIYVADTFAHRVQVFDPAGNYLRQWGAFGSAPGQLAATYSYTTRKLYVLDEPAAGQARLAELAVDGGRGGAHTIAVAARDASWNKIYLVPDLDGGLLIASSSTKKKKHVIARLNVNVSPPKLEALEVGNREFIVPPIVDGSGYTLLLRQDQGNDKIRRERLKSLTGKQGKIEEVGTGL